MFPNFTSTHPVSSWVVASAPSHSCLLLLEHRARNSLLPLAVGLGSVVATSDDEILRPVVVLAAEVGLEDGFGAGSVTLLGVDRSTRHVGNHGVSAAPAAVAGGTERVVLRCRLREPDIATVAAELTGLESLGDILLDNNGTTGSVDEP